MDEASAEALVLSACLSLPPQIVSAVQYCHQKRIIHRDLKVRDLLSRNRTAAIFGGRHKGAWSSLGRRRTCCWTER